MNNEPVAWMRTNKQWRKEVSFVEKEGFDIPLYTHPVQKPMMVLDGNCVYPAIKELTDEEIWGFMDEIEALVHGDIKRAMYRMARKVESILNE